MIRVTTKTTLRRASAAGGRLVASDGRLTAADGHLATAAGAREAAAGRKGAARHANRALAAGKAVFPHPTRIPLEPTTRQPLALGGVQLRRRSALGLAPYAREPRPGWGYSPRPHARYAGTTVKSLDVSTTFVVVTRINHCKTNGFGYTQGTEYDSTLVKPGKTNDKIL